LSFSAGADNRKIVFGAVWSTAGNWGRQILSLLILVVSARLLSPTEIGLFAIPAIMLMVKEGSLDWAMSETIVRHPDLTETHLSSAFWFSVLIGCMLAALVVACAHRIGLIYGEPLITSLLVATAVSYPLAGALAVYEARLRRELDFQILALRPLIALSIAGFVGIAMIFGGFGVWALVAQQITEKVVSLVLLITVSNWRPSPALSVAHLRSLFPDLLNIGGAQLLSICARNFDRAIISLFFSPAVLGAYVMGCRILETATALLLQGANKVAYVLFARLQRQEEELQKVFNKALECTAMVAIPAFVGLSTLAPDVVLLLFGPKWIETGPLLTILILAGIPQVVAGYSDSVTRATGNGNWFLLNTGLAAIFSGVFVLCAVQFGPTAIAASPLIRETVGLIAGLFIVNRLINVQITRTLRGLVPILFSVVVMTGALQAVRSTFGLPALGLPASVLLYTALGAVVYFLSMLLTARSSLSRLWALARELR